MTASLKAESDSLYKDPVFGGGFNQDVEIFNESDEEEEVWNKRTHDKILPVILNFHQIFALIIVTFLI